jgi:hypothetical protein
MAGLVQHLLATIAATGPAKVSLPTRITQFFEPLGFQHCGKLTNCSTGMMVLLNQAPSTTAR